MDTDSLVLSFSESNVDDTHLDLSGQSKIVLYSQVNQSMNLEVNIE